MSGGKRINEKHQDYPQYIEKCQKLFSEYQQLIDAEEERQKMECPNWMHCLDALETKKKRQLCTERNKKLKELQEEYFYLFEDKE